MDVLILGDLEVDFYSYLRDILLKRERTTLLASFIGHVTSTLRTAISALPRAQRQSIPPLNTLVEFLELYQKSDHHCAAVDNALVCFSQLTHWISLTEEHPNFLSAQQYIIGSSTGLIAAAAISSASSQALIVPIAIETVLIAFRLGLQIDDATDRLSTRHNGNEVWSLLFPGMEEESARQAIEDFNERLGTPHYKYAYVSGLDNSGVTISGHPDTLSKAMKSLDLNGNSPARRLRSRGLYHAPHIYSNAIIDEILPLRDSNRIDLLDTSKPEIPIFSPSNGKCYEATSMRDLLEQMIINILIKPQDMGMVLRECASKMSSVGGDCRAIPIGPIANPTALVSALHKESQSQISTFGKEFKDSQEGSRGTKAQRNSKIAIVGMSGRFPGASDVHEFWQMLQKGRDMHKKVPKDRFDPEAHFDPSGKTRNTSHTPFGCFVDNAGLFDPRFFNMSPREAAQTDPMQRLALMTAYEALEMSGYVPNRTPSTRLDRIGTFYGQTSDDWREINEAQDIDTYFITGGVRAFGPGRINYHFKFSGPSFNVDTACSSSMAALQLACTSLWAGDVDTAITGGLNIMTNPDIFAGLSRGQFLSKAGPCQTFDNDADGYCRGDGIGTVILKRIEDAEADQDNILGVILATATNHSANAISITHPHAGTQEVLYKKVLDQAGINPLDVGYVEMHGTGTQAGDGTEMESVTNVFAPSGRQRQPHQRLYLGSVKANVGHGEAASGVTALIKCLLILRNNAIPPHVGIKKEINQGFPKDLQARNTHIAFQETPFPRTAEKRHIYVNNFSAAGGNTAVLLEDAPAKEILGNDPRPVHVVSVSARALSSLKSNLQNLATYIDNHPEVSLPNLSYTTTARRIHHSYRISFPVSNVRQLRESLAEAAGIDTEPITPTKVAFTFTGQGSHYAGIATDLFRTCDQFRTDLVSFNHIATSMNFPSFLRLVDGTTSDVSTLSPLLIQVGLTCIQIALCRLWAAWGVKPDVVIGHSLGEYAALYAAGVLSLTDTIFLVGERARLLEDHCEAGTHAMLAVKSSLSALSDFLRNGSIEVACINGPSEIVLSGPTLEIESAKDTLNDRGIKSTKLSTPYAFHSSQVTAILEKFELVASSITFKQSVIPLLSPLLGRPLIEENIDPSYLSRHARETVNFSEALKAGLDAGLVGTDTMFVEIGPHPVTTNFAKATLGQSLASSPSLRRNEPAWSCLASTCSLLHNKGIDIDWNEYHRDFASAHELLELPAYGFALKNYWIEYKNNWCLTKGDKSEPAVAVPTLSTTSVQKVVQEEYSGDTGLLIAESDISRPDLFECISGHQVNDAMFCPSSLYGDMGVTVAEHMYRRMHNKPADFETPPVNICEMEVPKSLIAKPGTPMILKITANARKEEGKIDLVFSTGTTVHASCVAEYGDASRWLLEFQRAAHMVKDRINSLQWQADNGQSHVLLKKMVYKLFSNFVKYGEGYRGMQRVILDGKNLEATAQVKLQPLLDGQSFVFPPYWIDSVGHLSGFIMNGNDELDSDAQVYVSHGWESLRVAKPLSTEKEYRTYVRMFPAEGTIVAGDVYLFEEDTVIGVFGGLRFQAIPRRILNMVIPPPGGSVKRPAPVKTPAVVDEAITKSSVVQTTTVKRKVVAASSVSITSQVLDIIAEECAVDLSELADANAFEGMGVDSLMQLAISGRMREDLDLDIPSTLFVDCPTVGSLKKYLKVFEAPSTASDTSHRPTSIASLSDDQDRSGDDSDSSALTSPPDTGDIYAQDKVSRTIEAIATRELGEEVEEISNKLSMDLSLKQIPPQISAPVRSATSVILQGSPKSATKNLFLIPDGGGSATSYVGIPNILPGLCVFGLNSPYMKTPEEYQCGVPGMAVHFLKEIKRRQPQGPYTLSGWSAGGVIAFEVAQQLIRAGEVVDRLILIDSPCPLIIEPLPQSLHRWFNSIGLLGDGDSPKLPPWLLPHFQASINALSTYSARMIDPAKAPKTFAIWCEDGVCKLPTDPRPDPYPYGHAQWLLESKTNYGPDLWDAMVGKDNIHCFHIPGNHFTMMKEPNVQHLGEEMRRAMEY